MDDDYVSYNGYCQQLGHKSFQYSHICTYKQYNITRNCCSQCLNYGIHNHSMPNKNHIIDQKSFQEKVLKQFLNNQAAINKEQFLWQFLKNLKKVKQEIEELENKVEIQLNTLTTKDLCSLFDYPRQYQTKLDYETLERWIRNGLDFEVEQLYDPLNKIQQQINIQLFNLNEFLQNKLYQTRKSRKYEIQQIQMHQGNSAIISNNEKYLVYNNIINYKNIIHVYDIKMNKISKSIFKGKRQLLFQFSLDSQYLFALDIKGYIYGFFASKDFKQFYKQKSEQDNIQQIKIIQNYLLTFSYNGTIIKRDFLTKCCIFKYEVQNDPIYRIFDYDPLKDILINELDRTIEIWDVQNQTLLIKYVPRQLKLKNQMAELVAAKREQFAMQESRKYKYDLIQSNLDRSRPRVSQDQQKDTTLIGCTMSKKELEQLFQGLGSSSISKVLEQTYLFMQTVQKMMVDLLEWGKSSDMQLRKLQQELEQVHECVDRLHTDTAEVKVEVKDIKNDIVHHNDGKKEERKKGMEVQSIYAIIAGQTRINEQEIKTSLVEQLDKNNKMDELGLIEQGKWNHCIVETLSKVTKHRIVLFNSRTGRYRDFGDKKIEQKVMIYCRGSDCAVMIKSAKKKNFVERGSLAQSSRRGPSGAYGGWDYAQAGGIPFFPGRFPGRRFY